MPPGKGGIKRGRCLLVAVLALLVCHAAGSLAGRLAGGLALAAAAGLDALGQVAGRNGLDSLHGMYLSILYGLRPAHSAGQTYLASMITRFGPAVKCRPAPLRGKRAGRSKWCAAPARGPAAAGTGSGTAGPAAHRCAAPPGPGPPRC